MPIRTGAYNEFASAADTNEYEDMSASPLYMAFSSKLKTSHNKTDVHKYTSISNTPSLRKQDNRSHLGKNSDYSYSVR